MMDATRADVGSQIGVGFTDLLLVADSDANDAVYGKETVQRSILAGSVATPRFVMTFVRTISSPV
jgi:lipid-binding SYLF domain-containing protein